MFRFLRPTATEDVFALLQTAVPETLGDRLLTLAVYGEHVSVDHSAHASDFAQVSALIVLHSLDQAALEDLARVLRHRRIRSRMTPMVLSVDELLASTDVFPITFMEMKRKYRILCGEDVLADLPISDEHLQLRCEQELKNLLIRMQSVFLLQQHRPRRLLESLRRSYTTLVRATRAGLTLIEKTTLATENEVLAAAASELNLDLEVLHRVQETCRGNTSIGREAIADVYGALLVVVHRVAEAVDRLRTEIAVVDVIDD